MKNTNHEIPAYVIALIWHILFLIFSSCTAEQEGMLSVIYHLESSYILKYANGDVILCYSCW